MAAVGLSSSADFSEVAERFISIASAEVVPFYERNADVDAADAAILGAFNFIMDLARDAGSNEAEAQKELFDSFAGRLPAAMEAQRQALLNSMADAPEVWRINR